MVFNNIKVLRVRVLAVPRSEKFPDGVKYRYHYGTEDGTTFIWYDNSHAVHDRHMEKGLDDEYEFPGYRAVNNRFWDEVTELRE